MKFHDYPDDEDDPDETEVPGDEPIPLGALIAVGAVLVLITSAAALIVTILARIIF